MGKAAPKKVEEDSSSEEEVKPKAKVKATKKAVKPDDSSDEPAPKPKAKAKAAKKAADSDDSSDEPAPKPKAKAKAAAKKAADSDDSSDEPAPKPKAKAKAAKKAADSDDSSDEPAPKPKAKAKAATKKAADSDDSSDEPAPKPKAKAKAAKKDDSDSSDEPAPKPKAKAAKKEDSDDEEPAPKPAWDEGKGGGKSKGKPPNEMEVFVGGLPFACQEDTLRKDFEECGEIESLRMPLNEEGNCRGIAFIAFKTNEAVEAALKFNGTEYGGRWLRVNKAGEGGKGKDGKGKGDKGEGKGDRNANTVFIGGLPWSTTEEQLRKDFEECGPVENLRLPMNDEGNPRGIAFVKFSTEEAVKKAIEFDQTDYGGRTISVRPAGEGGKGKDGKGKDGKGKDGKGKGKKGKKGGMSYEAKAAHHGAMVESTGTKQTFDDSDSDAPPAKKTKKADSDDEPAEPAKKKAKKKVVEDSDSS